MTEIVIKCKGQEAKIWKQDLIVGGIVKDRTGHETVVTAYHGGNNHLEAYFKAYTERTKQDFFKN